MKINAKDLCSIKDIQELKSVDSINNILKVINSEITPMSVTAQTYEELFSVIAVLKKQWNNFNSDVYILKKDECGRHTPFHNKYRPQFYIRTLDVTGEITLPEGTEMVMPGDNVTIEVELIYPVACSVGLRFVDVQ